MDLPPIPPIDADAQQAAAERQAQLAKPPGSLARLEALSVRLAGMTGRLDWVPERKAVIVCAADHGVTAQGVSAYPQQVTARMVEAFIGGRAAVNVIARQVGAQVMVVDAGIRHRYATPPQATQVLVAAPIGRGTADLSTGPAMKPGQDKSSIRLGMEVAERLIAVAGVQLIAVGEMGIGNTTSASAIIAALTGHPPQEVTGRGAGLNEAGVAHKAAIIQRALDLHAPATVDTLRKVGGYEIGAMAGVMIAAAANRVPVVIDGLISTAGALIAAQYLPGVANYLIAGHRSAEPGHDLALQFLSQSVALNPLLDLGLRLGEGSGAALALPLIEAAARTLTEMTTLDEIGVR